MDDDCKRSESTVERIGHFKLKYVETQRGRRRLSDNSALYWISCIKALHSKQTCTKQYMFVYNVVCVSGSGVFKWGQSFINGGRGDCLSHTFTFSPHSLSMVDVALSNCYFQNLQTYKCVAKNNQLHLHF